MWIRGDAAASISVARRFSFKSGCTSVSDLHPTTKPVKLIGPYDR
jgi:hypothetical protein